MRRRIIAGNWKMHGTLREAAALTSDILEAAGPVTDLDVVLCPPFTTLSTVARLLQGHRLGLGAQDCYWERQGAFTGEVSPAMLKDLGATYCIVGHSERRARFGETNEGVARKTQALLAEGLTPIVCVGETLAERQAGNTLAVIEEQLRVGLEAIPADQGPRIVVAYEPVWAIGTGQNATPGQAQEVHTFIRQRLTRQWSPAAAHAVRIQYGGSVKPENSAALLAQPDVDGFLVGGASLQVTSFVAIIQGKGLPCTP